MAEIEDVPRPAVRQFKDFTNAPAQQFGFRKQCDGVKVALHGAAVPQRGPACIERHAPIKANHVRTRLAHRRQQGSRVHAEIDDRHTMRLHRAHQLRCGGQHKLAVVGDAERAGPAVKNLNNVGPGLHLLQGVLGQHADELGHQLLPRLRLAVHQLLRLNVVARAAALNHVAGKCERRTAEADDAKLIAIRTRTAEVRSHFFDRLRHIAQVGGTVRAQGCNVLRCPHGLVDDGSLASQKFEVQPHHFKWQQQVSKNDRCVHAQLLRSGDGHLSGDLWVLADFQQAIVFPHRHIFRHVAPRLTQEPNRCPVHGPAQTRAHKAAAGCVLRRCHSFSCRW